MITRGIVEKIITPYLVKVRIPTLNRTKDSSSKALTEELSDTPICTLNHYDPNLQIGDIVIVGFEDNNIGKPIILGYLYRTDESNSLGDFTLGSLDVIYNTTLSKETRIGDVTAEELQCLVGLKGNIQKQLDLLTTATNVVNDYNKQYAPLYVQISYESTKHLNEYDNKYLSYLDSFTLRQLGNIGDLKSDKTFAEIANAISINRSIILTLDEEYYQLQSYASNLQIVFTATRISENQDSISKETRQLIINSNDTVTLNIYLENSNSSNISLLTKLGE